MRNSGAWMPLIVLLAACAGTPDAPSGPLSPPEVTLREGPDAARARLELVVPDGMVVRAIHLEGRFDPLRGPKPKLFEPRGSDPGDERSAGRYPVELRDGEAGRWVKWGALVKPVEGGYDPASGTIHLVVAGDEGLGPGAYRFELPFVEEARTAPVWTPVIVRCTRNASVFYGPSDVLGGTVEVGGEWSDFPAAHFFADEVR